MYAFGVLLWEMCTGQRAWAAEFASHWTSVVSAVAVQRRQLDFGLESGMQPGMQNLAHIGAKCMAYNPEDRPAFSTIELWLEKESEEEGS